MLQQVRRSVGLLTPSSFRLAFLKLVRPPQNHSMTAMRRLPVPPGLLLAALLALPAAADLPVEVRLGVLWPDLGPNGGPDSGPSSAHPPGADANAEVLIATPLTGWTTDLPAWLRWAAAPRVDLGGVLNTAAAANQAYAGLTWTVPLARGILHQDDGVNFGFSIGPDMLGGAAVPHGLDQGPQLRLGAELGYQVTPRFGLFVLFDHVTGGPLTHESDSLNELGVRVGVQF